MLERTVSAIARTALIDGDIRIAEDDTANATEAVDTNL
jgi:hypothetical protein